MAGIDVIVVLVGKRYEQDNLDSGVEAVWHSLEQEAEDVLARTWVWEEWKVYKEIVWIYLHLVWSII